MEIQIQNEERYQTHLNYQIVAIQLQENEVLTPNLLTSLQPPQADGRKGVVLDGRAPTWLFAYLVHHYHPTAWIAINDPRLGAVIVSSHSPACKAGEVLPHQQ